MNRPLLAVCRTVFAAFDWTWDTVVDLERKIPRPMPGRIIAAIVLSIWGCVTEAMLWNLRATSDKRTPEEFDAIVANYWAIGLEFGIGVLVFLGLLLVLLFLWPVMCVTVGVYFLGNELLGSPWPGSEKNTCNNSGKWDRR